MLRRNFWIVYLDRDVFLMCRFWHSKSADTWLAISDLYASMLPRSFCIFFVIGMFSWSDNFSSEYVQPNWVTLVSYSSFMLRRNFWFVNFDRDVSLVCQHWQWISAAQMSGSQWVTCLSFYDFILGLSFVIVIFSWSDVLGIEYLQHN